MTLPDPEPRSGPRPHPKPLPRLGERPAEPRAPQPAPEPIRPTRPSAPANVSEPADPAWTSNPYAPPTLTSPVWLRSRETDGIHFLTDCRTRVPLSQQPIRLTLQGMFLLQIVAIAGFGLFLIAPELGIGFGLLAIPALVRTWRHTQSRLDTEEKLSFLEQLLLFVQSQFICLTMLVGTVFAFVAGVMVICVPAGIVADAFRLVAHPVQLIVIPIAGIAGLAAATWAVRGLARALWPVPASQSDWSAWGRNEEFLETRLSRPRHALDLGRPVDYSSEGPEVDPSAVQFLTEVQEQADPDITFLGEESPSGHAENPGRSENPDNAEHVDNVEPPRSSVPEAGA